MKKTTAAIFIAAMVFITIIPIASSLEQKRVPMESQVETNRESIQTINSLATAVSVVGFVTGVIGIGTYVVKLTNVIGELKASLKADMSETKTSLMAQVSANREEIIKVHSKFEVGLVEQESACELLNKEFNLLQLSNVSLQKDVQTILRSLDRRVQRIEITLEEKSLKSKDPDINIDIEAL